MHISQAYLWLIFLPASLIPGSTSSKLVFRMMYSAYKLNKQSGNNIALTYCFPPVWIQSSFPSPVLTVASSPAYRFLRLQIRCFGVGVSLSIFQYVVTHTVQGCFVLSEGELHVLLEFSSFICDPADVGNLLLSSSAFSKSHLSVLKFLVHFPLKTWRL